MSFIGNSIRLLCEPVRSLAFGAITGAYMGIGIGFSNASRILYIQNLTDVTLMFSLDGINDNFPLPSNAFLLLDITTNKTLSCGCFIAENTRVYVRSITGSPSLGAVYVTTFYGAIS